MGIEIIPISKDDNIVKNENFQKVSEELIDYDLRIRSYAKHKDENAIFHDTYLYFLVNYIRSKNEANSAWFLTRDNSIIQHSIDKKIVDHPPYAIKIFTLLQTLSPFIESQALKGEFADLFADLISKDLLPKDQLLSLEDLKMLVGFDVRSKAIPPEFVRKATYHIKSKILKGGGITEENKSLVVQEYLKFLATPEQNFTEIHKKYERKLKDRDEDIVSKNKIIENLQAKYDETNESFSKELNQKTSDIDSLTKEISKLKELLIHITVIFITFIISAVLWFNEFPFYINFLSKLNNPFYFNLSIQIIIISSGVLFIFPDKRRFPIIAGILGTIASIILGFINF